MFWTTANRTIIITISKLWLLHSSHNHLRRKHNLRNLIENNLFRSIFFHGIIEAILMCFNSFSRIYTINSEKINLINPIVTQIRVILLNTDKHYIFFYIFHTLYVDTYTQKKLESIFKNLYLKNIFNWKRGFFKIQIFIKSCIF